MGKKNPISRKTGLALGGGAALGPTHIGILKAFEEKKLRFFTFKEQVSVPSSLHFMQEMSNWIKWKR
jgi:hypothetical protein